MLKNVVLEKGEVSKRNLIESPFTMILPEGIRGIFNSREIDEIIELTNRVLAEQHELSDKIGQLKIEN